MADAAARYQPEKTFTDFDALLADPSVHAVLIAVADEYHVPLSLKALAAGKHVLVEKPLSVTVEESAALCSAGQQSGLILQIGHNRRFEPGVEFAHRFIANELGQMQSYKGCYYDSRARYIMTNNLQPLTKTSAIAKRPARDQLIVYVKSCAVNIVDPACSRLYNERTFECLLRT